MRLAPAIVALALALLSMASLFDPGGRARAQDLSAAEPDASAERDIIEQTNAFRVRNGLGPTVPNATLTAEARGFAAFLADARAFSHTADGRSPSDRAEAAGYRACLLAENIARVDGVARQGGRHDVRAGALATQFVVGWETSPGHRHNMLDPSVTETGVGVVSDRRGDVYAAVQVFGRPDSLRFSFRIDNRTEAPMGVTYDGEARTLRPGAGIVYTACSPGELTFDRRISGVATLRPQRDRVYRLLPAPGGGVQLDVIGGPSSGSGAPAHHP